MSQGDGGDGNGMSQREMFSCGSNCSVSLANLGKYARSMHAILYMIYVDCQYLVRLVSWID